MSKPSITALEKAYVYDAMEKGDIGVGEYEKRFEEAWSKWNGYQYGVSCSSGTTALHLAVMSLGIGPGDEVVVPEFTMISTAWAVSLTGATPIFADCDDDLIVREWPITEKTKAVITVPIYGRSAPIPEGIPVIEDMAEAHGIKPKGTLACYSFYGNKILSTGEGGMVLTNDPDLMEKMDYLKNAGMDKERTMLHPRQAYNYRMTNLQAAVGLAQVERIEEILFKRKMIEEEYEAHVPNDVKMPKREVLWMYDIQVPEQERVKKALLELGVPTRYGFKPMSMQPQWNRPYEHLNAYKWSKRILYLPTYTDMKPDEIKEVCQKLHSVLA